MTHPVLKAGATALITGGASGIGLVAAERFAALGLNVVIVDRGADKLAAASARVQAASAVAEVMTADVDVSSRGDLEALKGAVTARFGTPDVLMNNAGIGPGSQTFGPLDAWEKVLGTNLWGVIHGTQVFVPDMIASGRPGLVINTGSKQGITTPPGDPAYNISKAGVKVFTEALEHELRNSTGGRITAHLLIPGFVFTPLTAHGRTEKPAGAWTPEETVDFMLEKLDRGDFYILCPDNEAPRALDEKRIAWAAGDIVDNRPPLSRWHKDFGQAFKDFVEKG